MPTNVARRGAPPNIRRLPHHDPNARVWRPQRMRHWYESIADLILAHPDWSTKKIAEALGRSYQTILCIVNSDTFQHYFAERRALWNARHDAALQQEIMRTALLAHRELNRRLNDDGMLLKTSDVQAIASGALDAIMGPRTASGPSVHVNVQQNAASVSVDKSVFEEAQTRIRLEQQRLAAEAKELQREEKDVVVIES